MKAILAFHEHQVACHTEYEFNNNQNNNPRTTLAKLSMNMYSSYGLKMLNGVSVWSHCNSTRKQDRLLLNVVPPPQKKKIPVGIFPQSHNLKQITCRPKAKEENYVDFSCASVCARARVRVFGAQSAHSLNLKGWKTKSIKLH